MMDWLKPCCCVFAKFRLPCPVLYADVHVVPMAASPSDRHGLHPLWSLVCITALGTALEGRAMLQQYNLKLPARP